MATATKHPPVQEAGNTSVRVEIFDQAYNLRGTDPDYILQTIRSDYSGAQGSRGFGWNARG